jgi:hypothetical protein
MKKFKLNQKIYTIEKKAWNTHDTITIANSIQIIEGKIIKIVKMKYVKDKHVHYYTKTEYQIKTKDGFSNGLLNMYKGSEIFSTKKEAKQNLIKTKKQYIDNIIEEQVENVKNYKQDIIDTEKNIKELQKYKENIK